MKRFFYENKLTTFFLVVAISIVISYILTDNMPELFPYGDAIFNLFSNFSLAYIASFIFFILVQYLPEIRKRKTYQRIALQQLRKSLYSHARLFLYIFKSSSLVIPNRQLNALEELFNDSFYDEVKKFDITKQAPVNSSKTWAQYIAKECMKFTSSLERITDKYSFYLDSDLLEIIENLRHSYFISFFLEEAEVRIFTDNDGWVHIDDVVSLCNTKNYSIFDNQGEKNIIKEHLGYFLSLVQLYNETFKDKPIKVNNELWKDTISPKVGSARENMHGGNVT